MNTCSVCCRLLDGAVVAETADGCGGATGLLAAMLANVDTVDFTPPVVMDTDSTGAFNCANRSRILRSCSCNSNRFLRA